MKRRALTVMTSAVAAAAMTFAATPAIAATTSLSGYTSCVGLAGRQMSAYGKANRYIYVKAGSRFDSVNGTTGPYALLVKSGTDRGEWKIAGRPTIISGYGTCSI